MKKFKLSKKCPPIWRRYVTVTLTSLLLTALTITTITNCRLEKALQAVGQFELTLFTYFKKPTLQPACFLQSEGTCLVGAATNARQDQVLCWGPLDSMLCNNSFRSFLSTGCNGRLGNVMMAYATLFYFYRFGFNAMLTPFQFSIMNTTFVTESFVIKEGVQTYPSMPLAINHTFIGQTDDAGDIDYNSFIPQMSLYKYNFSLDVGLFPCPFNLFKPIMGELKLQFQFRPAILESARNAINLSVEHLQKRYAKKNLIYVAVHFRRGDYLSLVHFKATFGQ